MSTQYLQKILLHLCPCYGFVLAVCTACVSQEGLKMCICNIYKEIALPGEFIQTVTFKILEPAAFKKDSKAVASVREKWLCSLLWIIIIIIIPGFKYSVGL